MKVEYEKTMMDRLLEVKHEAKVERKVIKCVRLCKEEWKGLHRELGIDMSGYDYSGKKGIPTCYVYGMRVEYSDESMSTVCHEYEPFSSRVLIPQLTKERDELKKDVANLECQVGSYKGNNKIHRDVIKRLENRIEILTEVVEGSRVKRVELEKEKEQFRDDANLMTNKYWQEKNKLSNLEADLRRNTVRRPDDVETIQELRKENSRLEFRLKWLTA